MGYAKYKEDIEKIRSANIFGSRLDFRGGPLEALLKCPFCSFEHKTKAKLEEHILLEHRDAALFLEYKGQIVPEAFAFGVRPVQLTVRCLGLPDGVDGEVRGGLRSIPKRRYKDGQFIPITPPDEQTVTLTLGLGGYRRVYAITFKKRILQAKLTLRLIELLDKGNGSLSSWGWPEMDQFKQDLSAEPGLSADEKNHRLAIWEYCFGIWLEQQGKPEYRRHLEKAFEVLRNFDEPVAQLISNYFLYRVNMFSRIPATLPFPRLRRVSAFFDGLEAGTTAVGEGREMMACEIVISDCDSAVFEAVDALLADKESRAQSAYEIARTKCNPADDQAGHRLTFLRFKICRATGNNKEARACAERLLTCSVDPFKQTAELFLKR